MHFQSNIVVGRGLSKQALKRNIRLIATNHVMPENLLEFSLIPQFARMLVVKWLWWDANRIYGRAEAMTSPTRRAADLVQENTDIRKVCSRSRAVWMPRTTRPASPRARRT